MCNKQIGISKTANMLFVIKRAFLTLVILATFLGGQVFGQFIMNTPPDCTPPTGRMHVAVSPLAKIGAMAVFNGMGVPLIPFVYAPNSNHPIDVLRSTNGIGWGAIITTYGFVPPKATCNKITYTIRKLTGPPQPVQTGQQSGFVSFATYQGSPFNFVPSSLGLYEFEMEYEYKWLGNCANSNSMNLRFYVCVTDPRGSGVNACQTATLTLPSSLAGETWYWQPNYVSGGPYTVETNNSGPSTVSSDGQYYYRWYNAVTNTWGPMYAQSVWIANPLVTDDLYYAPTCGQSTTVTPPVGDAYDYFWQEDCLPPTAPAPSGSPAGPKLVSFPGTYTSPTGTGAPPVPIKAVACTGPTPAGAVDLLLQAYSPVVECWGECRCFRIARNSIEPPVVEDVFFSTCDAPPYDIECLPGAGGSTCKWYFQPSGTIVGTTISPASPNEFSVMVASLDPATGCESDQVLLNVYMEPCADCIESFSPNPGENFVLSAWVKEDNGQALTTYDAPGIALRFLLEDGTTIVGLPMMKAKGNIIDGWQRIEEEFEVPNDAFELTIGLANQGISSQVFFDDIRVHPFNSNMKSFVYDPVTLRLMAELDENNYATFYEYDEEGALIRVKKETERGVKTIQESRNNTAK